MRVPIVIVAVVFIFLCILMDVRTRRIPNLMSAAAILAGVSLNALYFGAAGLLGSLAGSLAAIAVLLIPFALGGVGGGDVKMMGALGALLGPTRTLAGLGVGVIYGGVVMVVHLIRCGRLREKVAAIRTMLAGAALTRSIEPLRVRSGDLDAIALPYSVPLGLGTVTVLALVRPFGLAW